MGHLHSDCTRQSRSIWKEIVALRTQLNQRETANGQSKAALSASEAAMRLLDRSAARLGFRSWMNGMEMKLEPSHREWQKRAAVVELKSAELTIRRTVWIRAVGVMVANTKRSSGKIPTSIALGVISSIRGVSVADMEVSDAYFNIRVMDSGNQYTSSAFSGALIALVAVVFPCFVGELSGLAAFGRYKHCLGLLSFGSWRAVRCGWGMENPVSPVSMASQSIRRRNVRQQTKTTVRGNGG